MADTARGGQVRSVAKAMELLEALLRRRAPMSLHELSAAVGYPRSTVHALLSTLREHGMVAQGASASAAPTNVFEKFII